MIDDGARIVGIESVILTDDKLVVTLALSDGSTAATWWPRGDLYRFISRIDEQHGNSPACFTTQ